VLPHRLAQLAVLLTAASGGHDRSRVVVVRGWRPCSGERGAVGASMRHQEGTNSAGAMTSTEQVLALVHRLWREQSTHVTPRVTPVLKIWPGGPDSPQAAHDHTSTCALWIVLIFLHTLPHHPPVRNPNLLLRICAGQNCMEMLQ
jgi:hypothetical protein